MSRLVAVKVEDVATIEKFETYPASSIAPNPEEGISSKVAPVTRSVPPTIEPEFFMMDMDEVVG